MLVVAGEAGIKAARSPEIMADAAIMMLSRDAATYTGHCEIDSAVLRSSGVSDLSPYGDSGGLEPDIFLDPS